jgi:oligopeptide/dipeptide ABC transporter ATP-binding protein
VSPSAAPLLEVSHLRREYSLGSGLLRRASVLQAVKDVSFTILPGETFSLVGESGSGKTTVGNLVLGLDVPTAGSVTWRGRDLSTLNPSERRRFRGETNAVFQDPIGSLDPRMTVGASIVEPLRHERLSKIEKDEKVTSALRSVGLQPEHATSYPHEFSGGQRQRIAIARALIRKPSLIVLDEPVAALDISIQAQVLNLLKELQRTTGTSYLMISHNLATVRFLSHWIGVMYLGQIVEFGPSRTVLSNPAHPYTRALVDAAQFTELGTAHHGPALKGEPASPFDEIMGCPFHPRCVFAQDRCKKEAPPLLQSIDDRDVACHFPIALTT